MRELRRQFEQIEATISRVAWELRPASIDELGLPSALSNYVSEWSEEFRIEADFHCRDTGLGQIGDELRTTIYRVAQEALTNVAKHAEGVTAVSVIIDRTDSVLRLTIEDNGCGFRSDPSAERGTRSGGHGIAGMRERLILVGGELDIESSSGAGTTVFACIPLEPERAAA